MARHDLTESDLLHLVEGTLPPERRDAVRRALESDPALLRSVERLVADRRGLRVLGRETPGAPPGLLEDAIAGAERDALLPGAGAPVRARTGPGRRTYAIAAAALLVVVGGWAGFMLWAVGPGANDRRSEAASASMSGAPAVGESPETRRTVTPRDRTAEAGPGVEVGPPAPADLAVRTFHHELHPPMQAPDLAARDDDDEADEPEASDPLLESWLTAFDEEADPAPPGPEGADGLADAVAWLRAGELAIEAAPATGMDVSLNGAGPTPLGPDAPGPRAPEPGETFGVRLVFDRASDDEALRATLDELLGSLWARGVTGARFVRAEAGAEAPRPAFGVADVLWWADPVAEWAPRLEATLTVRVVEAEPAR